MSELSWMQCINNNKKNFVGAHVARLKHLTILLIAFLSLLVMNGTSMAAEIEIVNGEVKISGRILYGDWLKFEALVKRHDGLKTLRLHSRGGKSNEAFKIGEYIKSNNLDTYIEKGECLSSCALIWLAGKEKYAHPKAVIGFHQTSHPATGRSGGNTEVGVYLARIGYSYKTAKFVASAGPDSMKYLYQSNSADAAVKFFRKKLPKFQTSRSRVGADASDKAKGKSDRSKLAVSDIIRYGIKRLAKAECIYTKKNGYINYTDCNVFGAKTDIKSSFTSQECFKACKSDLSCLAWEMAGSQCGLYNKVNFLTGGDNEVGIMAQ